MEKHVPQAWIKYFKCGTINLKTSYNYCFRKWHLRVQTLCLDLWVTRGSYPIKRGFASVAELFGRKLNPPLTGAVIIVTWQGDGHVVHSGLIFDICSLKSRGRSVASRGEVQASRVWQRATPISKQNYEQWPPPEVTSPSYVSEPILKWDVFCVNAYAMPMHYVVVCDVKEGKKMAPLFTIRNICGLEN